MPRTFAREVLSEQQADARLRAIQRYGGGVDKGEVRG